MQVKIIRIIVPLVLNIQIVLVEVSVVVRPGT